MVVPAQVGDGPDHRAGQRALPGPVRPGHPALLQAQEDEETDRVRPHHHLPIHPTGRAWVSPYPDVYLPAVSSKSGNYKELDPELRKRLLEQCPELAGLEDALSAMGSDAADWLIDYNTLDIGYRIGSGTSSVVFRYDSSSSHTRCWRPLSELTCD